jgi:hypothetical protein
MRNSGMPDMQIINTLKEEGVSPREISEAFSQLKIKSAISGADGDFKIDGSKNSEEMGEMQPSISTQYGNQQVMQVPGKQSMQDYVENQMKDMSTGNQQYPNQENVSVEQQPVYEDNQQQYANNAQYYSQGLDLETVRDIAKQEIDEKLKIVVDRLAELMKLKTDLKFEIQSIENRLVKVEDIIHELQSAIIRKMGEYGDAVSSIATELKETQKSFSKMVNPIMDKKRGASSEESEEKEEEPRKKEEKNDKNQKGVSFEDYLR